MNLSIRSSQEKCKNGKTHIIYGRIIKKSIKILGIFAKKYKNVIYLGFTLQRNNVIIILRQNVLSPEKHF